MAYEIRAMSLGEVLGTAFQLIRDHFMLLVGIAFTMALPINLFSVAVVEGGDLAAAGGLLGLGLFLLVISPIASAAITYAISEVYLGRSVGFGDSLKVGLRLFLRLVGTAALMMIVVILGLALLIIPGLYLALAYLLTYQVVVIEDIGGWNALKRSQELTKNNMLRILAIYLVSMILMTVVGAGFELVTAQFAYVGVVLNAFVQAVFTAYMSAAFVVVYFDIRCRKEAFDIQHLSQLVSGEQSSTAVSG
jgi:hypothetical protein